VISILHPRNEPALGRRICFSGQQATFACSAESCLVNTCSQIRHFRTLAARTLNTLPCRSVRVVAEHVLVVAKFPPISIHS